MRRLLPALFLAAALWLVPAASSAAVVQNVQVPLNVTVFNPCNGDLIAVTGSIHLLASTTSDGGGGFHIAFMDNVSQVTGTGSVSGATYHGVGGDWFTANVKPPFPVELTMTDVFGLISAGSSPNLVITDTFHITVNADGTLTANVARFSLSCNG
jgi:hypothetical protein